MWPSGSRPVPQDDWRSLALPRWEDLAAVHARSKPTPVLRYRSVTIAALRARIEAALLSQGSAPLTNDYSGTPIFADRGLVKHLIDRYDGDHLGCFGWIVATVVDPIEVWHTFDDQKPDNPFRRYYLSAYSTDKTGGFFVSTGSDGMVRTGHRIKVFARMNKLRVGTIVFRCYS